MGRYFWLNDDGLFQALEPVKVSTGSSSAGRLVRLASDGKFDISVLRFLPFGLGCVPPLMPLTTTDPYYCPMAVGATAGTTFTVTANRIYWYPFLIWKECIIKQCVLNVTDASPSTNYVGIYNSDQFFYPSTLLTSGSYDSGATGVKVIDMSPQLTLIPGVYWVALCTTSEHVLRAIAVGGARSFGLGSTMDTAHITYWYTSGSSLPSTAPVSGYNAGTTDVPAISMLVIDVYSSESTPVCSDCTETVGGIIGRINLLLEVIIQNTATIAQLGDALIAFRFDTL